ncbi:hypothetical protein CK203_010803 [Vitis vinifera]|uniref:Uncharacterized protein n=1 Tax=Vitis vinifera TaxID=29760 RepID=A0A438JI60_VITVI|nr:hypothetical protein CK203_010803 [Vitis vinifera]
MGSIVSSLMGGGAADASDSTLEGSGVKYFTHLRDGRSTSMIPKNPTNW